MTKTRWELQLEGTADGGRTWHAYRYWNKPGGPPESLDDAPRTLPPGYFLRSDWRMWFLPLAVQRLVKLGLDPLSQLAAEGWYAKMAKKLLEGEPDVTALVVVPDALKVSHTRWVLRCMRTNFYA
jgi:hypothetical protein